jgi:hypothetical protein
MFPTHCSFPADFGKRRFPTHNAANVGAVESYRYMSLLRLEPFGIMCIMELWLIEGVNLGSELNQLGINE